MNDQQNDDLSQTRGVYKIIEIQTYMCQSTSTQFGIVRNAEIGRLTACWWQAVRGDVGIFCSKYQETSLQLGYRCKPVGFIVFIFDCFILIIIITVIMENATHTHTHIQVVFWALSEYVNLSGDCSLPSGVWVPRRASGLPSRRERRLRQVWMLQGVCCTA